MQKITLQIEQKKVLWLKKIKILCHEHTLLSNLNWEETVGTFYQKELQKTNQKEFRLEKVIKRKCNMLNGKVIIICLIAG